MSPKLSMDMDVSSAAYPLPMDTLENEVFPMGMMTCSLTVPAFSLSVPTA